MNRRLSLYTMLLLIGSARLLASNCKNVLAYYAWWNKPGYSSDKIPFNKLTHICHTGIVANADGSLAVDPGYLEPALNSGAHAAGAKVLVTVDGVGAVAPDFRTMVSSAPARATFVQNVKNFVITNSYDGADIDWEFPANAADRSNLTALCTELRAAFDAAGHPELLLSIATSNTSFYLQWLDLNALKGILSYFNVMTYPYHGGWSSHMGHVVPLAASTSDPDAASSIDTISYFLVRGVPAAQLHYGMEFDGTRFPVENLGDTCPSSSCSSAVGLRYNQIAPLVGAGWTRYWDASATSPYLRSDTLAQTISYDDPQSIQAKSDWALNVANLGGIFMWELSEDRLSNGTQPLLDAMIAAITCVPTSTPTFCAGCSPTHTLTASATATPAPPQCGSVVYDGEAGSVPLSSGGGYGAPAPSSVAESASGAHQGANGMVMTMTWTGWWAVAAWNWAGWTTSEAKDVSGAATLEFWMRSAGTTVTGLSANLIDSGGTASTAQALPSVGSGWQKISLPMTGFTGANLASIWEFKLSIGNAASGNVVLYLDDLAFQLPCVATATSTFNPATTATWTPMASTSPTPSLSATLPGSPTPSPSETPYAGTPTISETITETPTLTESGTSVPFWTPTVTPSFSDTPAPMATSAPGSAAGEGSNEIERTFPAPNPGPTRLWVKLLGSSDLVTATIYSRAFTVEAQVTAPGRSGAGWVAIDIEAACESFPQGTHFFVVKARRGGVVSKPAKGSLVIIR